MWPNSSSPSFPTKADRPPRRETAMATLAGAPPGALRKPGASASEAGFGGDEVDEHLAEADDEGFLAGGCHQIC